ncbi:MAG: HlyD family efflux transporter periplasmic adaptor subunit [Myxococcota bacterium]
MAQRADNQAETDATGGRGPAGRVDHPPPLQLIKTRDWVGFLVVVIAVFAGLGWATFGEVRTVIAATGVIGADGETGRIELEEEGVIVELPVEAGEHVERGQKVADIRIPALDQKIERKRARQDELHEQIERITREIERRKRLGVDDSALTRPREERDKRETLYDEVVNEADQLEDSREYRTAVRSPYDGVVVDISLREEMPFRADDVLMVIGPAPDAEQRTVAFVPQRRGRPQAGQRALVLPSEMVPTEHGYIRAEVEYVSSSPQSRSQLERYPLGQRRIDALLADGDPYLVRLTLVTDESTHSGLSWTLGAGPDKPVPPNSICAVQIISDTLTPLELAFPTLRD